MSMVHEHAVPPPHLLQGRPASWQGSLSLYNYSVAPLSPISMSPQPLHSYISRLPESPVQGHELHNQPVSGLYGSSIPAQACQNEHSYASYDYHEPSPHTSAPKLTAPPSTYSQYRANPTVSNPPSDPVPVAVSPVSPHPPDPIVATSKQTSEEPQLAQPSAQVGQQPRVVDRSHRNINALHSTPNEVPWTINSLGIHSSHDPYHPSFSPLAHSPGLGEPLLELPPNHLASPQPRRLYTPIAPQPIETPRSHAIKRSRDEDDEVVDDFKRRKRSDSTASAQLELSEEDKLLLQLKEEDSMPWKDIAARFQSDLGKVYQIPALQMRLKRLRERMRVWTETDVRALRMAHEFWVQNKFDIISQKMLEFGASEKWTARQCARKWSEMDPAPTPYAHFEQQFQPSVAPYSMSPIDPPHTFLPYMHT